MEHINKFRTIVYIDVEEFQPTSRRPLSSPDPSLRLVPSSPIMASTSCIEPLASPDWAPRSRSPENWGPTSPGPVPSSPPYIPRSPESTSGSTSPTHYYPTSPGSVPPSPPYIPRSPEWVPGSVSPEGNYYPTSPGPGPPSPAYLPRSSEWVSASPPPSTLDPTSPPPVLQSPSRTHYYPTSPGPVPPSPPYIPRSPVWVFGDTSPENYYPTSPGPGPQSPAYTPLSPRWVSKGTSPTNYYPTSPGPVPPSPPYAPQSPQWVSTSPSPVPLSPSSPATTGPFDELERELDGSWGRGRFVYNRARSIVSEEEEEHRQRRDRETSIEPFPELPYWEEDETTEGETEDGVQDFMVHEPAAAVPKEEEGELPDYGYYKQLDQEEEGVAEIDAEDVEVQEPVSAVPEESSSPLSNYLYSGLTYGHPSTPFPWRRSSPSPSTPSASPEEPEISEDLPDNEYYEELDQETAAETLIRLETEHMHSVADNPYTTIAALNCEPQSNPFPSYPSSETGMQRNVKEEHANWISSCSSCRTSSAISNPACRVPQKLMGYVKVQKRVDRMMWNKLMQKKMVRMMEVCEKYAPADVLKGLKQ